MSGSRQLFKSERKKKKEKIQAGLHFSPFATFDMKPIAANCTLST